VFLAAALAVGLLVGLVSGLTGIGGGVLMVPFLYVLYASLHVDPGVATVLAHGTSLAIIVPTAIRGLVGYRASGLIRWRAALPLAVSGALAAAVMAQVATQIPAHTLRLGFAALLALMAADLLLRRGRLDETEPDVRTRDHTIGAALLGLPVGALSAALGIGGGLPAALGMHYLLGMPFRVLAATSLAIVTVTAAAGSVSYLLQPVTGLPFEGVIGHVDFAHGLPLAIGAFIGAPFGVRINRRVSVPVLRRVFGVLLLAVGVHLFLANL